ncbi:MAG: hypothetical protein ACYTGZ_11295 [Planctomycetota bacterium]|jgi:hypothetical protein
MRIAAILLGLSAACCAPGNAVNDHPTKAVRFEVIADPVWTAPERGSTSRVAIALRITNGTREPLRFNTLDTIRISLRAPDGQHLTMDGGRDGTAPGRPLSDPVAPGKRLEIDRSAHLAWTPGGTLRLQGDDGFGGVWYVDGLQQGRHELLIEYENRTTQGADATGVWKGKRDVPSVAITLEVKDVK